MEAESGFHFKFYFENVDKFGRVLPNNLSKQELDEYTHMCSKTYDWYKFIEEGKTKKVINTFYNWIKENNIKLEAQNYFRKAVNGEYEFKPLNLFVQYYQQENPERQKELDACSKLNHSLKHFNKVFSLTERLTYKQIFELTNDYSDCINVIANSDIYFNETILFSRFMRKDDCYALSRWDYQENGLAILFDRKDSQDAWVFNGAVK